jgi:hypothetical protein
MGSTLNLYGRQLPVLSAGNLPVCSWACYAEINVRFCLLPPVSGRAGKPPGNAIRGYWQLPPHYRRQNPIVMIRKADINSSAEILNGMLAFAGPFPGIEEGIIGSVKRLETRNSHRSRIVVAAFFRHLNQLYIKAVNDGRIPCLCERSDDIRGFPDHGGPRW